MPTHPGRLGRRELLKALAAAPVVGWAGRAMARPAPPKPRFLIVIAAGGGASIIDSLMAVRESEAGAAAANLNCFPDREVDRVGPFTAVHVRGTEVGAIPIPFTADQRPFVRKRQNELMVATVTGTSVNHQVGQKRSLTGNDANGGRTLQEAVAAHHGAGFPLPNVNMAGMGYIEPGIDPSTPAWAYAEPVAEASLWPLSLHGSRGIRGAPAPHRIDRARALRSAIDPASTFAQTFAASPRLSRWQAQREAAPRLEAESLITRLNVFPDAPPRIPLSAFDLESSPDGARVRQAFPDFQSDPFDAQAALAFLLLKNRVSVTVTIGPSFSVLLETGRFPPRVVNPPLAFDFSHNDHRSGQAVMWQRIFSVADRLADLLAQEEFEDGESLWDRSLIYVATEFGRTRQRPGRTASFGTGHDLNNGFVFLSPMVNGGRILGGVDPSTGMTYGFDGEDPQGAPRPGTHMAERDIHAGILHALEVPTTGLPDMRAMRRRA